MRGELKTYGVGINFTADESSLSRIAMGGTVKLAAFTAAKFGQAGNRVIPAGTVVKRDADNSIIPADGSEAAGTAYIMASEVVENPRILQGSDLTTGLYAGGIFYEDRLPDATAGSLSAGLKTALGPTFRFQKAQGSLVFTK